MGSKKPIDESNSAHDHHEDQSAQSHMSMSRRSLLAGAAVGSVSAASLGFSGFIGDAKAGGKSKHKGHDRHDDKHKSKGSHDLVLVNGRFVDGRGKVATSMTIVDGRIAALGHSHGDVKGLSSDARTIDLRGRTVIPGFINGHVHHSRTGRNPGYEVRDIETAFSIRELQELIARRAKGVPDGKFICCHLGWHYVQLAENRAPTKAELDAAAPKHPVFISGRARTLLDLEQFFSVTNSLGQTFFQGAGLTVDNATGRIAETPETALAALNAVETPEDKLRETWDNNAWTLSNGLTSIIDASGSPSNAQSFPALELWRQGRLHVRHRMMVSSGSPEQVQARAANVFRELGDDLLRMGGFGETVGSRNDPEGTYEPTARAIATSGWRFQHHTDFFEEIDFQISKFQLIAQDLPIKDLRWAINHAFQVTESQAQTLKELGIGLDLQNERYLDRLMRGGGPFFRRLVDAGLNISLGTDGSNFAPNNPWLMMYYATTGVNVAGQPDNADQTITRLEALRLFTAGSAYMIFDDDKLGSFQVGKLADLAVLNQDFLTVSDAKLRKTKSIMTIVGGKIVHEGDWPEYAEIGEEFHYTGT